MKAKLDDITSLAFYEAEATIGPNVTLDIWHPEDWLEIHIDCFKLRIHATPNHDILIIAWNKGRIVYNEVIELQGE